jgi:hypothetical protein
MWRSMRPLYPLRPLSFLCTTVVRRTVYVTQTYYSGNTFYGYMSHSLERDPAYAFKNFVRSSDAVQAKWLECFVHADGGWMHESNKKKRHRRQMQWTPP